MSTYSVTILGNNQHMIVENEHNQFTTLYTTFPTGVSSRRLVL